MRSPLLFLIIISALMAVAALAAGMVLDTSTRLEINNCAAGLSDGGGGSAVSALPSSQYLLRVFDEDVFLCLRPTGDAGLCGTGGERFANGSMLHLSIPRGGHYVSCRSDGGTGDLVLTRTE